ncbi:hypothetical protein [Halorhodospira halophila]|uniref:Uncharacterized protein n=1 Tax=Halorhodospira halophila (strain DSM 244 / SL1) TaxID=349124 RepID=A1WU22_HALHL|nr:hypothetical protein [Halorhodospira halophila]ABM61184.1 hypothetical protein Hhal_0390 [Halorhodospira halophila SL1]MBK1729623.1 hypothetical protein [Halorhodospira halophila]
MAFELFTVVGLALAALVAAIVIQRRGGRLTPGGDDALTRACHGDQEQADRLEAAEQERAGRRLSRNEARRRAAERLKRDRV